MRVVFSLLGLIPFVPGSWILVSICAQENRGCGWAAIILAALALMWLFASLGGHLEASEDSSLEARVLASLFLWFSSFHLLAAGALLIFRKYVYMIPVARRSVEKPESDLTLEARLGQKVATVVYVIFAGLGGALCLGLSVRLTIWPVEGVPVVLLYAVGMVFVGSAIAVPLTKAKWRHKPHRKGQFDNDPFDGF